MSQPDQNGPEPIPIYPPFGAPVPSVQPTESNDGYARPPAGLDRPEGFVQAYGKVPLDVIKAAEKAGQERATIGGTLWGCFCVALVIFFCVGGYFVDIWTETQVGTSRNSNGTAIAVSLVLGMVGIFVAVMLSRGRRWVLSRFRTLRRIMRDRRPR
jgi:hypothetical protein